MTPYTIDAIESDLRAAIDAGDQTSIERLGVLMDETEKRDTLPPASLHAAALWYASNGLKVFPLSPGTKIPFKGSNGCKDASSDADIVGAWWTDHADANIGIATGHLVDVVDIDGRPGQESRIHHWDPVFAKIDGDSLGKVLTPRSGGMHIYLPATGDGNSTHIVAGVDYRGRNGYVVAPPSRTPGGTYRWLGRLDLARLSNMVAA